MWLEMAEHWVCLFDGRAGARAQAMFPSKDEARQFAERHARALGTIGVPLRWNDLDDPTVLTTPAGTYRLVRMNED